MSVATSMWVTSLSDSIWSRAKVSLGSDLGDNQPRRGQFLGEGFNDGGDRIGMRHKEVEIAGAALHDAGDNQRSPASKRYPIARRQAPDNGPHLLLQISQRHRFS